MLAEFFGRSFLGNTIFDYGMAIAFLVGGFFVINIARILILGSVQRWATQSQIQLEPKVVKILCQSLVQLLYIGDIFLAIGNLTLHPILQQTIRAVAVIATTAIAIRFLTQLIEFAVRSYLLKKGDIELERDFSGLMPIVRMIIWAIGAVFLLDNLGFDISAIIASLGLGGLAIAFAAQGVLGDLFSYFSIILDRPFSLGDFINVGDIFGTVEYIGIKTTRIKSISGEQVIIANTDLTGSRIRNFKQMTRRRIAFNLGILYETPQEKLAIVPVIIQKIIDSQEFATFDRAHFLSYGEFSLNYEIVYYVESADYALYMDIQQRINLAIFAAFAQEKIEFANSTNATYMPSVETAK